MSDNEKEIKQEKVKDTRKKRSSRLQACMPELVERVYELSACLLNDTQIANALNIPLRTFYTYKADVPEFADALRRGFALSLESLARDAIQKAKIDTKMQIFLLKTKGKFIEDPHEKELEYKEREIVLKEKVFKLSSEKFISELCEKYNLSKEETLEFIDKHLKENDLKQHANDE